MHNQKILFIIKERQVYGTKAACYGLVNSCQFVVNSLKEHGIMAKVVQVVDSNGIDKVVHEYKPTHCFIEALWVVPSKFEELAKLHPKVKWIIRIHSMIPFLVSEGMCFDWLNEYFRLKHEKNLKIYVSCNNEDLHKDLNVVYNDISYSPNIYNPQYDTHGDIKHVHKDENVINIGCFGALRVLKNHAQQAIYCIEFANKLNKVLHLHVNVSEYESNETSPVLKNLRAIFKNTKHKLIEHTWMPHQDFIELVKQMDLGIQLTFTETFNIVAADFVANEVPIIVSKEIDFVHGAATVDISNRKEVLDALHDAYNQKHTGLHKLNTHLLKEHNKKAEHTWWDFLKSLI
jgi:hypothetical protein